MSKGRKRDARDPRRKYQSWAEREDDFEARPLWMSFKWLLYALIGVLALVAVGAILVTAFGTGTAEVKGRSDAYREKVSGTNRIQSQARFEDLYSAWQTYPARLAVARRALDRAEQSRDIFDDQIKGTDLDGLTQQCIQTATDYNADARKYTAQAFRAADLPESLDPKECQQS